MMRWPHWFAAFVVAVLLHAALALLTNITSSPGVQAAGRYGVEVNLGMLADAGASEQTTLGNAAEEVAKVDEVVEEKVSDTPPIQPAPEETVQTKAEPLPQEQVTEIEKAVSHDEPAVLTATEPDLIAINQTANAPMDRQEPVQTTEQLQASGPTEAGQVSSSQVAAASQMTTGEASDAQAGGVAAVSQDYLAQLAAHLGKYKRYPHSSRRRSEEGVVMLFFVVDQYGRVERSEIRDSSGHARLDQAGLKMLQAAQPLPPLPHTMTGENLQVTLPVAFRLNG
jgi:protein TonB